MFRILIANGVNLDLLGTRPKQFYGERSLKDLEAFLSQAIVPTTKALKTEIQLTFFQSNDEASYLQKLGEDWHGALLNPGAWTHTSLALADRLEALQLPFVEVHLSHLAKREPWRQASYATRHSLGVVYGFGFDSYLLALHGLIRHLLASESVV